MKFDEKPSSHKKARGRSAQYKRQEILTLVKLDRYYHERILQAIKEQEEFDLATVELATKIAKAPWKDWGLQIFGKRVDASATYVNNEEERYIETLGYLLQASSSLRPKIKFTSLSPLAFNQTILSALWDRVQEQEYGLILSVFSDLFSHYLVALSDEDFLKYHCKNSTNNISNKIMAKDLVEHFSHVLHTVYWTKPVVCNEIQMDNSRGRLILSGTKLWNSVYERWNRLVNTPFCEESTWWFPQMGFKEGDRAVIRPNEINDATNLDYEDDDSMDIDDDQAQNLSSAEEATDRWRIPLVIRRWQEYSPVSHRLCLSIDE